MKTLFKYKEWNENATESRHSSIFIILILAMEDEEMLSEVGIGTSLK